MGNTPSQAPPEGSAPAEGTKAQGGPRWRQVLQAFRSVAERLRNWIAYPWVDVETQPPVQAGPSADRSQEDADGSRRNSGTPAKPSRPIGIGQGGLPARGQRDRLDQDPPDLRAREEGDHLAIYHPDQSGARISSDTWCEIKP